MAGFTHRHRRNGAEMGARLLAAVVLLVGAALAAPAEVEAQGYDELEARIWMSAGESPVLRRGDRASIFYRATTDAYVAIFHVDTDGIVRLLHPRVPDEDHYVRRGITYRLRFDRSGYWYVDDYPGVGYFFIVASWEPMDFSAFRYSHLGGGWDLANVGRRVYQDPYLAMDDFVAALVPDWQAGGYALDFVEYNVDRRFDYPRFLCYDCHRFRPYRSWNPYRYQCHSFRLIIHTDPYFYPVTRYRGTRVVYARPPVRDQPRFAFKERARGEPATPIFQRSTQTDLPGVAGAERRRSTADGARPPNRSAAPRATTPGRGNAPSADAGRRDPGSASDARGGVGRDAAPRSGGGSGAGRPAPPVRSGTQPEPRRPSDRIAPGRARPNRPEPGATGRGGSDARPTPTPSDRIRERTRDGRSGSDRDPPRPVLERRPPGQNPRSPSPRPDGSARNPDAGPSTPGARPSGGSSGSTRPGNRPTAPSPRARPDRPRGRTVEPSRSEPRRPQRAPAPAPRSPEPRQRTPDRSSPSARSPSSGGRARSPAARTGSGSSASPAPRGGGDRSGRAPGGRGRGRPPR